MKLSKYFTEAEFEQSETAARKGINNDMSEDVKNNAILLCKNILDPIRLYYKKPLIITSGYRCKKLNTLIGGSSTSQHCFGKAADFIIPGVDLKRIFNDISKEKIVFGENYDQLIFEFGKWIHISRDLKPRKHRLLAHYINKAVVYSSVETV